MTSPISTSDPISSEPVSSDGPRVLPDHAAFPRCRVEWVKHWNEHLFSFALERPASFRFRSGEFVMVGLSIDGKPLMRAYSIASPAYDDKLEFLSIKVPGGPLTGPLQGIVAGDEVYLGKKPTGTLVADALLPGQRLFMLSTGTGLAPFMSLARDPDIYERFDTIVIVHSVRRVSDLAYHGELSNRLADDPLIGEQAATQFHYIPTVTREPFERQQRIGAMLDDGSLFAGIPGGTTPEQRAFDPEQDRVMLCGSTAMIREFADRLEGSGFTEGSNAHPGQFVIERAFVG